MREKIIEEEIVQKEREVKICDYCRLFTSEDIDEDEEFGEVILNPGFMRDFTTRNHLEYWAREMVHLEDEDEALKWLLRHLNSDPDIANIDLCPHCVDDLFGDGPASMRREANLDA